MFNVINIIDQVKNIHMRLFIFIIILLFPLNSYACSCGESSDIESRFKRAYSVILAEVTNTKLVKTSYNGHYVEYIVADIDIIETFKRSKKPVNQVIDLVPDIGNCSIVLVSGMEYIFFIDNGIEDESQEIGNDKRLGANNYVGQCTGSHHVNMYHKSFSKIKRRLKQMAN